MRTKIIHLMISKGIQF